MDSLEDIEQNRFFSNGRPNLHITKAYYAHEKATTDLVQIIGPKNIGLDTKFAYLSWTDKKILN